jgi:hypothetical protein
LKNEGLDAFVGAIERHWAMRGGRERALAGGDFALARSWFEAGMPLATVLAGIDEAFDRERRVSSLGSCECYVRALVSAERRGKPPRAAETPDDLVSRLESAREAIHRANATVAFERAAGRIADLLDLIAVAREPNAAHVLSKLRELDELLDAAALEALPAGEATLLDREAAGAIGRLAGQVDREALDEARRRYLRRRARERFALARLVVG